MASISDHSSLRTISRSNSSSPRGHTNPKPRGGKSWMIPAIIAGFYFLALVCAIVHYVFFRYLNNRVISQGIPLSTKTTSIPQAYVTTVSLLLVTAFRAALLASVGTCYTQLLWATFRERVLKVHVFTALTSNECLAYDRQIKLIEDLFQVQSNVLRLGNRNLYLKTPILAVVAVFSWLIPIATIYPPGALVVNIETLRVDTNFKVSSFHTKGFTDIVHERSIAKISCDYGSANTMPGSVEDGENATLLETCYLATYANARVDYLTRSNLLAGEMASFSQPTAGNSSYSLTFWGATLDCETKNKTIERTFFASDIRQIEDYAWSVERFGTYCMLASSTDPAYLSDDRFVLTRDTILTLSQAQRVSSYQYYPCLGGADEDHMVNTSSIPTIDVPTSGINVLVPMTETVCRPKIAKYEVAISHSGGKQQVSYSIHSDPTIPAYSPIFQQFDGDFDQWMQFSDGMAIYANFVENLNRSYRASSYNFFKLPGPSENATKYTSSNGTVANGCLLETTQGLLNDDAAPDLELWPLSVFERRLAGKGGRGTCPSFDLDMAKDLLANTTISALSSSEILDTVNGSEDRSFNLYHFQNKLVFFLPYGLSLALTIPIVLLGFIALYIRNQGVSAITGGFLQLLMTTTGRTSIDAVLAEGNSTMGGFENVSDELREMEVGFGELIVAVDREDLLPTGSLSTGNGGDADDFGVMQSEAICVDENVGLASGTKLCNHQGAVSRRAGFGTIQEIRPL